NSSLPRLPATHRGIEALRSRQYGSPVGLPGRDAVVARRLKKPRKRNKRFIAASSFCAIRAVPNQQWRCMPRWLLAELPLLAAGAAEYERRELSRRAESASRTGRPSGD